MGAIETHFMMVNFYKFLLFTSTTEKQIEESRHMLELCKEQEKSLMIN